MSNEQPSGTLFVISAPSGGGKTSLIKALVAEVPALCVSVSHTTRAPRTGEIDGQNYFFVNENRFQQLIEQQVFLEYAKVFNHWYGTSKQWVVDTLATGQDVILELDWQGARLIRAQLPCISIFILPPSRSALINRLQSRKQDSQAVIEARMSQASEEISHFDEYEYVVINDAFEQAQSDLAAIVRAHRLVTSRQKICMQKALKEMIL